MIQTPTRVGLVDVTEQLPANWTDQIEAVASHAREAVLTGDNPTSLEPAGTEIRYGLVDGTVVARDLPWLDALYRGEWLGYASDFAGMRMSPSDDLRNGVNINVVSGSGGRYEWHYDSNPCTGLLFVSTLEAADGGELVFRQAETDLVIRPRAGHLLIFDARETAHCVRPVRSASQRVSVPLNYFVRGHQQLRAESLDEYLYSTGK